MDGFNDMCCYGCCNYYETIAFDNCVGYTKRHCKLAKSLLTMQQFNAGCSHKRKYEEKKTRTKRKKGDTFKEGEDL